MNYDNLDNHICEISNIFIATLEITYIFFIFLHFSIILLLFLKIFNCDIQLFKSLFFVLYSLLKNDSLIIEYLFVFYLTRHYMFYLKTIE